jgi:hypothetical protein
MKLMTFYEILVVLQLTLVKLQSTLLTLLSGLSDNDCKISVPFEQIQNSEVSNLAMVKVRKSAP